MRLSALTKILTLVLATLPLTGHSEDLLSVYRQARANDPVLSQSDAARLSTVEGVVQARALLLPQISGSHGLTQSKGSGPSGGTGARELSNVGPARGRNLSVTLAQPIVDFGKWADVSAAKAQSRSQEQVYQAALQALYVRVTAAYFGVLTGADQLTFAKANEEALRQAYEQADRRFQVGLSAITDRYQARSRYEQARAQTIQAENTLNDAREALTQITGKHQYNLKKLREDLPLDPPLPVDPEAWVALAAKNNPSLAAQEFNIESAEHRIDATRAGHLPAINASVARGKYASQTGAAAGTGRSNRWDSRVGLTLTVPIFSGGATQSQVRQSIYNRDSAQDALESQRRQVTRDTLNFYRTSVAGISQVEAAKAGVDSGQKALEATRAGFDVGTQTMLNVLTAIQTLTQAQSTYSQSRHNFVLNKLQLKQTAGTVDMKDIEEINTLLR
jgi:outer membrane protein